MIQFVEKSDLLELFRQNKLDGIAHQTNIEKAMGKGIALKISQAFPEAKNSLKMSSGSLGEVSYCQTPHGIIFNVSAQSLSGIGRKTNYEAFYRGMEEVSIMCSNRKGFRLGVPYMIGCGLGGGDWRIISAMLYALFEESSVNLIVCKKD